MRKRNSQPKAPDRPEPGGRTTVDPEKLVGRLQEHLQFLGLTHTHQQLDLLLQWASRDSPGATEFFERVLGDEVASKSESRLANRIRASGLVERKTLEAFDFDFQPTLDRSRIAQLGALGFIKHHDDIVVTGMPGTGKSHLLKAFGLRACQQGIRVRYARCVDLVDDLYAGLADGSYPRRLRAWASPALLIIDDVGLGQVRKSQDEPTAAHTLFNLLDRRHGRASTAVTSNIKLSEWGKYLGDATIAAAILDRLAMNGIRIDINGPSYRQHVAKERAKTSGQPSASPEPQA